LYSLVPAPDFTFTLTPFFFHIIAIPIGDSFEILGGFTRMSDSVVPTIIYSCFSFESTASRVTLSHIFTFDVSFLVSSISSTFFN